MELAIRAEIGWFGKLEIGWFFGMMVSGLPLWDVLVSGFKGSKCFCDLQ